MDSIALLPNAERLVFFREAARRRGVSPVIIEKDFWVCWILKRLFSENAYSQHLTFKGGTSLSKAYNTIQRFSEDIDLTIDKSCLGEDVSHKNGMSLTPSAARKRTKRLRERSTQLIREDVAVALREWVGKSLQEPWQIAVDDQDPQTLWFYYPRVNFETGETASYIKEAVRLEFGVLGDSWPTELKKITPYVCEELVGHFKECSFEANVLTIERAFWEKVTLLHAEYHRPDDKEMPARLSRHYYDIVMLAKRDSILKNAQNRKILQAVVDNKMTYFTSSWASYETAIPGSIKVAPHPARITGLASDYRAMPLMFLDEPPPFQDLMEALRELEKRLIPIAIRNFVFSGSRLGSYLEVAIEPTHSNTEVLRGLAIE